MRIGVMDSGIGGLTILKSLINKYPNHEYIYFGDNKNVPYGDKTREELITLGNNNIKFLENNNVDIIVIACGTLSSMVEDLSSNVPLIDIVSPLLNKLDNYKEVSIIATPMSIKTNAYKKYIKTKLNLISAPLLVPIIESNDYTNLNKILNIYLESTSNSDALILGCTHYPIIKDYISNYYKGRIITLDEYLLDKLSNLKESSFKLDIYYSKLDKIVISNTYKYLNLDKINILETNL